MDQTFLNGAGAYTMDQLKIQEPHRFLFLRNDRSLFQHMHRYINDEREANA